MGSQMKDSFGREINYLRIAVTDRCNFLCRYCIPPEGITLLPRDEILSYEEIIEVVKTALKIGINRFRITGGEPLLRTNLVDFIKNLIELPGVEAVSLTTNGYLLEQYADEKNWTGRIKWLHYTKTDCEYGYEIAQEALAEKEDEVK